MVDKMGSLAGWHQCLKVVVTIVVIKFEEENNEKKKVTSPGTLCLNS